MWRNKRLAFWIMVAVQVLALLSFAGTREYTLRVGREVVLQTIPVDPRDLFRGDYVVLRYTISTVESLNLDFSAGETVYVTVEPKGEVWQVANVSRSIPSDGDVVFIRGQVSRVREATGSTPRLYDVTYGIENYFVPEGKGREIERASGQVRVKAAVDGFGNAVIKDVTIQP